jgi:hypothetical protein
MLAPRPLSPTVRPMKTHHWWKFLLYVAAPLPFALWPSPVLANMGLPMVALFLPSAWFALAPIIFIESAYGVWRFGTAPSRTGVAVTAANCISTLIGLPATWAALALGQLFLFARLPDFAMELPLVPLTVIGAAWLGPGAEQSPWMVPLAAIVLAIPFYLMSVLCEGFVVRRLMPDLPRGTVRSWMLGANAASYSFLLVVTLTGWMWPRPFESMAKAIFPVTSRLVESVLRLAAVFQSQ